jgi:transposase-like protein
MARNQVQFQKGLSEASFAEIYGTEEQCHAALVKWRWPNGFECPGCNGADHCVVTRGARRLFQCNACRKQTSVTAGTIFASSKLPLRIWFKTIYLVTQSKKGISSIELGRRLGVTQTAAWMIKHKLAQVMLERNASKRLKGNVQMDDAYVGGARSGRRGRGAPRRRSSLRSRQRTMASRIKSSFGPSKPSAALRSESSQAPRSRPAPRSSPTVWHASPLSPKPDACTRQ